MCTFDIFCFHNIVYFSFNKLFKDPQLTHIHSLIEKVSMILLNNSKYSMNEKKLNLIGWKKNMKRKDYIHMAEL